jgi:hypothetical protein
LFQSPNDDVADFIASKTLDTTWCLRCVKKAGGVGATANLDKERIRYWVHEFAQALEMPKL